MDQIFTKWLITTKSNNSFESKRLSNLEICKKYRAHNFKIIYYQYGKKM